MGEECCFCKGRLLLQSDWRDAVRFRDQKVWTGYQEIGKKPKFAELSIDAQENKTRLLPCSDASFKADIFNEQECLLTYTDSDTSCSAKFVSSLASFPDAENASVQSVDVAKGGIGVYASAQNLFIWNTESGVIEKKLEDHNGDVYRCRFFPSGLVILSAGADMQIKIFSAVTGECARTLIGHTQGVTDVGIIDVGRKVVSCSRDGSCKVWECGSAQTVTQIQPECGPLNALAVGQQNREAGDCEDVVVVGSEARCVAGYSLNSVTQVFKHQSGSAVNAVGYLQNGNVIFGSDDGSLSALDLRNLAKPVFRYETSRGAVQRVIAHRTGFLASFGDGTVVFEELKESGEVVEFSGADGDPVYDMALNFSHLFTCARDKFVRKYKLPL